MGRNDLKQKSAEVRAEVEVVVTAVITSSAQET